MSDETITIRPYQPGDAEAFRSLNEAWITKHFKLEEADHRALSDPENYILRRGGHIFIAVLENKTVGCCALLPHGPNVYEVAKMAVDESFRGRGIGRKILSHTIKQARQMGFTSLYLESNSSLADAVHLYESLGFRHLPKDTRPPTPYARANVFMEMKL